MEYTIKDVEKITEFKTWTVKQKTDALLYIDCNQYCNLGKESSKTEKELVKKQSKKIYTLIKRVDHAMGELFLQSIDKR
tara:strand:- start:569 stop:805 length:237 start_codon:yes stop_codon:yes gene_type:complete